ncbi:MAG: hypothetical protein Q4G36_01950 [Paracoccus sp. (in: a-proteobacteria)]|nr:hypothetical protein [Paracoccus sp. (in: a-proteobacteria)]
MRLLKILIFLLVLGFVGLAGYAYFGDMDPPRHETRTPVRLDMDGAVTMDAAPATEAATEAEADAPAN